ncbi:hypothetical protein [Acinetobacter rudis]|uniref:Uncharacterized protein n=1 Tax=Acinetobacter rudis TaxID=632955 RepID=A0AAW8JDY4_9GAMM|nr:hypothetical protein [Acinetobacter rudis]MDQ8937053.1 hypothetical protein [Acinetobacter rudis]MDQ9019258.1 hypothetical protein [Acinetobacter rudis]
MPNLISAQEAFNAVVAGKHVLCRAVGELMDFDDLDRFPATIFAKPGYEFCIKIETIEVAGIAFTKPLTLDEYQDGQKVYVICTYSPSIYVFSFKTDALIKSIDSGFVQRDEENARLQLKALSKVLGRELTIDCSLIPLGAEEKIKSSRKPRTKKEAATVVDAPNDVVIEAFKATTPDNVKIETSGEIIVKQDNIVSFDSVKADMKIEKSLRDRIATAEKIEDLEALLPELKKLHGESGHTVMTAYEQKSQKLKASESLDIDKLKDLTLAAEEALTENQVKSKALKASFQTELSRSQNVLTVENVISSINKNEDLTQEDKADLLKLGDLRKKDIVNAEYDEKLENLMYRASIAETPAEANAQIRYTKGWTEAQLAPLHRAISKRLTELNKDSVSDPAPSLMRDIQNAQDLTTLDALEIDVSSRAPDMQKVLMAEIVKRRFELENM